MILVMRCDAGPAHVPSRVVQCAACSADCWLSEASGDATIALAQRVAGAVIFTCRSCLDAGLDDLERIRGLFGRGQAAQPPA